MTIAVLVNGRTVPKVKKKVNPRKIPATQADVHKAKKEAENEAIRIAWAIMFTCLRDKEGWGMVRLRRLWGEIENLSDSIVKGYVTITDLMTVLEEDGIMLKGYEGVRRHG